MVAINFHKQFAPDIRSGRKTQTIRQNPRCKTGDTLQLYAGQRTENRELIGTAMCAICELITIYEDHIALGYWRLPSGDAEHIAKIDGFDSLAALCDWFRERYGLPFQGYRIMWHGFTPSLTAETAEKGDAT